MPLADSLRPSQLCEVVGQEHILGKNGLLTRIAKAGKIPNMIFYGPPGVGKTTVAAILAKGSGRQLHTLNGTTCSTTDIKDIVAQLDGLYSCGGAVLYLDEIQYLNKKQQQTLLQFIENGSLTLIASTADNPYFSVYKALLSRCTVFEFKPVSESQIELALGRIISRLGEIAVEKSALSYIAQHCGGDVRSAINTLELALAASEEKSILLEDVRLLCTTSTILHDTTGDEHYDLLSALQKSIRGSDADAAIYYLARILSAGDLLSPCRRLMVIASEDIGLAYPQGISIVKACVDSANMLGLPEARIPLACAVILLATAPKSNSAYTAINSAMKAVADGRGRGFARAVQNCHLDGAEVTEKGQGYLYPHDFPSHWVRQTYLPDDLAGASFYTYGDNRLEQLAKAYWDRITKG